MHPTFVEDVSPCVWKDCNVVREFYKKMEQYFLIYASTHTYTHTRTQMYSTRLQYPLPPTGAVAIIIFKGTLSSYLVVSSLQMVKGGLTCLHSVQGVSSHCSSTVWLWRIICILLVFGWIKPTEGTWLALLSATQRNHCGGKSKTLYNVGEEVWASIFYV